MKKSKIKLGLNKKNISSLKSNSIIGGATGQACEPTRAHHKTCFMSCNDSHYNQCPNR
ncbi:hypothetical protein H2O64_12900 [Kordia sp. YSTF-M3]|uniref:Bacteriocin n=1 Tax=Kordia aestuariivivens TaxID=2759037 RepID=A0ABR7QAK1_9FLAO|nr:hypothetical protein [Kordia aestuariivivens]MBC8755568.1 hypothetical protein [Kordia aestuariivivens]